LTIIELNERETMTELKDALWLVLDTETTGTGPEDTPVEVAFALTSMTKILVSGSTLVNPAPVPMRNEARAIHHIDPVELLGQPTLRQALKGFASSLAGYEIAAFTAHFAEFDSRMLPQLKNKPWLCTCRFAQRLLPELPHHGNQYLRYELGLEVPLAPGLPAHRAMADTLVTAAILQDLLRKIDGKEGWPQDVQGLVDLVSGPQLQLTCGFTKHRGKTWEQVVKEDRGYAHWLLTPKPGQKPLEADLVFTLNHWLGSK
jgi:exodeoxyribonuclease X